MFNGHSVSIKFLLVSVLWSAQAHSEVYDIGNSLPETPSGGNITSVGGLISSNSLGTFSGEAEVEAFLNNSTYQIQTFSGGGLIYTLNNANASWDVELGGSGSNITLISNGDHMEFDFSTENDISDVFVFLRNQETRDVFQFSQSNNVSNYSFMLLSNGNLDRANYYTRPYDSEVVFISIPAPSISVSNTPLTNRTFAAGGGEETVFKFVMTSDSMDAEIHSLTLSAQGNLDNAASIGDVSLYADANVDGIPDTEELVATTTYTGAGTELTFDFSETYRLAIGDNRFIVTYEF